MEEKSAAAKRSHLDENTAMKRAVLLVAGAPPTGDQRNCSDGRGGEDGLRHEALEGPVSHHQLPDLGLEWPPRVRGQTERLSEKKTQFLLSQPIRSSSARLRTDPLVLLMPP